VTAIIPASPAAVILVNPQLDATELTKVVQRLGLTLQLKPRKNPAATKRKF
jgi:multidrug resistance efflux pump